MVCLQNHTWAVIQSSAVLSPDGTWCGGDICSEFQYCHKSQCFLYFSASWILYGLHISVLEGSMCNPLVFTSSPLYEFINFIKLDIVLWNCWNVKYVHVLIGARKAVIRKGSKICLWLWNSLSAMFLCVLSSLILVVFGCIGADKCTLTLGRWLSERNHLS